MSTLKELVNHSIITLDVLILEGTRQEQTSHYELKLVMKGVLEEKGFKVTAPQHELLGRLDLIAQKDDYMINGEVGMTPDSRVWENLYKFNEIWVLPYDFGQPHRIEIYRRGSNFWNYKDFLQQNNDLMKRCPKCGKPNFFSATRCMECGDNLEKECLLCSKCGKPLDK